VPATAAQPSSLAGQTPAGKTPITQTPAAHVPHNLPTSQTGSVAIADSLNEARQAAQKNKIDPDSDGSVSLTNWVSRLHRRPTSNEMAAPRTNALAPATVADRSEAAGSRQPVVASQQPNTFGAGSGDPRTIAAGNYNQAAVAKTPNNAQLGPPSGLTSNGRSATPASNNTLTGWLTRPFRSGDNANDELLATQHGAAGRSGTKSPVRLPAVTQTGTRPMPNGYARQEAPAASAADVGLYAERGPSSDTLSPVRFGGNVRLSAADPSHAAIAAGSVNNGATSGATNAYASQDATNRVSPTTGYQPAAAPYQSTTAPMMMPPRSLPPIYESAAALPAASEAYEPPTTSESATNPLGRPKIIFNPVAGMNGRGQATVKPTVQVSHDDERGDNYPTFPSYPNYPPMRFAQVEEDGSLPPPDQPAIQEGPNGAVSAEGAEGPVVTAEELPMQGAPDMWVPEEMTYEGPMTAHDAASPFLECAFTVLAHLNGPRSCPPGIGVENVMNAPFWIDTTQPLQNCRIRADGAADWEFPDRIEYFWARTPGGKGPLPPVNADPDLIGVGEPSVDYQEVSFYIERGGERFSIGTDLPIRAVDPEVRSNTTGFADMRVTTKTVLLDGKDWQLTQIFHTYLPTGSDNRGTGNGHVSLEPGVAWRYKWSDVTYFHGDLTYWFPIAADPDFSGQMLNYGIGISHIWIDGDKWAIMPTFELNAWTVLDGRQTFPFVVDPLFEEIDTLSVLNIHPGLRWVCDTAGDCGVREFGISSGIAVTEDHWYEEILRLELRWVF
jgi:hypothetical protein